MFLFSFTLPLPNKAETASVAIPSTALNKSPIIPLLHLSGSSNLDQKEVFFLEVFCEWSYYIVYIEHSIFWLGVQTYYIYICAWQFLTSPPK